MYALIYNNINHQVHATRVERRGQLVQIVLSAEVGIQLVDVLGPVAVSASAHASKDTRGVAYP